MDRFQLKLESFTLVVVTMSCISALLVSPVKGQFGEVSMPCTSSMMRGFTPCMNFITGSTADGSIPTPDCCEAFKSLMSTSIDCGCMLVTASVPLPLGYIRRNLALSLPRLCGTDDAPVQCQGGGSPYKGPGGATLAAPSVEVAPASALSNVQLATPSASSPSISFSQAVWLTLMGLILQVVLTATVFPSL